MQPENKEEQINEIFDDIASQVTIITDDDLTNASGEMEEFFLHGQMRPGVFPCNQITSVGGYGFTGKMNYCVEQTGILEDSFLRISSATLKECPYPISGLYPEEGSPKADVIHIFGHPQDMDDEFSSRLDQDFIWKIPMGFETKFRIVRLTGAFKDIPEMKQILFDLYNRMTLKTRESFISLAVESRVRDDDGNPRTIANLVRSGYIKPGILDNPSLVRLDYMSLSPKFYAKLFTKDLVVSHNTLFDDEDVEGDD